MDVAGHSSLAVATGYMHLSPAATKDAIRLLEAAYLCPVEETYGRRKIQLP